MAGIQVMNDMNDGGGAITSIPQSTVFVGGQLVSINGATGTSHTGCPIIPAHCAGNWTTANGNVTVLIGGVPVNTDTDIDTCTHTRVSGSTTVFVG